MAKELKYEFSDLLDGAAFPEGIGQGVLRTIGTTPSIEDEPSPITYYYVKDGYGVFEYTEVVAGPQIDRHGLIAVPGMLEGTDADISLIFADPLRNFDPNVHVEAFVQIGLGYRGKDKALEWVGGMVESFWTTAGGWAPEWRLSAVQLNGPTITYLGSIVDVGTYRPENDLTVRVKQNVVGVMFNGVNSIEEETAFQGGTNVVLWVKVYLDDGVKKPVPLVKEIQAATLESGLSFRVKEIPGHFLPVPPVEAHFYHIPIKELIAQGSLREITRSSWEFKEDVTVERREDRILFAASKGSVIVAPRQTLPNADVQVCRFKYS